MRYAYAYVAATYASSIDVPTIHNLPPEETNVRPRLLNP